MPDPARALPVVEPDAQERLAPLYRVLIHNDDVTPIDYVVHVLVEVFAKANGEAVRIMNEAHNSGVALVEIVPLESAEFHVDKAHSLARTQKLPLTFSYEPED